MDSFTMAVVVGGGLVILILFGLIALDRGTPQAPPAKTKPPKK